MGAFAMTAVLLRPWAGRISDSRGRKILIIFGGISVALTVVAYAFVDDLVPLVILRCITGIGEAAFYVGVASVINDLAPEARRGEALSYFSLALFGGLAVGPVIGETLLEASGFDAVWWAIGASAAIAGVVGFFIPDTRPPGATDAGSHRLIHRAAVKPGSILASHIWALATFSSFVPLYALQLGLDGSKHLFVVNSAIIIAIRLFGARLPDILGPRRAGGAALVSTLAGMTVIGLWAEPAGLFAGTVIFSIGHSLAFPALMTLALRGAPPSERGAVVGTFTAFFDGAFGVGAISAGAIADALGYRGAFMGAGVVALVGLVALLGFTRADKTEERLDPEIAPGR
jgi:MFS family permease